MAGREKNGLHSFVLIASVLATAVGVSGCFDLTQKVSIARDGSGRYEASIAAQGIVGEALRNKTSDIAGQNHAATTTTVVNGNVTQTSVVDFKSLSDLKFNNEAMSLTVEGNDFFGLGPERIKFRRTFLVDRARREHEMRDQQGDQTGREIAQSLFGGHTYVFSVTLPGSIDSISPVTIGGVTVKPEVTGDFLNGHTIIWRMPLYMMISAHALTYEVEYSAYGFMANVKTKRE
jgi:hypothetical protein